MAERSLVIGSRGSPLALWQATFIANELTRRNVSTTIRIIKTTGDHLQTASLVQVGGKGLFTKEIEDALLDGTIDLAVHSLKDLPTQGPEGLTIAAIPPREDPRDALVGRRLQELDSGAKVGTSSNRRGAQLKILRGDLAIEPIRGNVDTRLRKLREGQYDAIVLAAAGLKRLGLSSHVAHFFAPEEICPAPGQGALAIQTRVDGDARLWCSQLDHVDTNDCVSAERTVLARLGGGCQLPIGAHAEIAGNEMQVAGVVVAPDGSRQVRGKRVGTRNSCGSLAESLAEELLKSGAAEILHNGTG